MTSLPAFTTLGSGPTVLMLHGAAGGHLAFAPQVESLASSGWRAVAWDMPGYGHSAPIEPYTFKGLAASCIALIDALDCGSVVLVGHGMGAMLAQEVVLRRPELVGRLVLSGAAAAWSDIDGDWQRALAAQRDDALDRGLPMAQVAELLVPQLVGSGALPEGVRLARHVMAQVHPATWRRAIAALPTFDRSAALGQIHVPTLLITGGEDRQAPPALTRRIAARIAGSTVLELPGVGHLPNLEAPEAYDAAVLNFLALPRQLLH
jgi:pimeloyl-ACP methyl ester carboxylesterase